MFTDATSPPVGAPPGSDGRTRQPTRSGCSDLGLRPEDLILHLHQEILEMMPAATACLPRNGRPLCRRLAHAVLEAAGADQPAGRAEATMRRVGA
ncbi:MAG TPA: hypothetical protein VHN80_09530, partial [Kineosporiaceae bacterium]|nr:hypothetical protein [Kineosporiaceae bacterium]